MSATWQDGYQAIRPDVLARLRFAFRSLRPEQWEDAMQEAEAIVVVAYERLYRQGRVNVAFPTTLAHYATRQFRAGRRVGGNWRVNDVSSRGGLERLDRRDTDGKWKEVLLEDTRTPVPDQAAFRIDFATWLSGLPQVKRAVVALLATRETTTDAARQCGVTAGRVSQMRRELHQHWKAFSGEYA